MCACVVVAISQAFACLSDTDKRQAYDRFGFDPDNRQPSSGYCSHFTAIRMAAQRYVPRMRLADRRGAPVPTSVAVEAAVAAG